MPRLDTSVFLTRRGFFASVGTAILLTVGAAVAYYSTREDPDAVDTGSNGTTGEQKKVNTTDSYVSAGRDIPTPNPETGDGEDIEYVVEPPEPGFVPVPMGYPPLAESDVDWEKTQSTPVIDVKAAREMDPLVYIPPMVYPLPKDTSSFDASDFWSHGYNVLGPGMQE